MEVCRKYLLFSQVILTLNVLGSHFRDRLTKLESKHQDLVESKENTHTRMASKDAQLKKFEQRVSKINVSFKYSDNKC